MRNIEIGLGKNQAKNLDTDPIRNILEKYHLKTEIIHGDRNNYFFLIENLQDNVAVSIAQEIEKVEGYYSKIVKDF